MAALKTKKNDAGVDAFIDSVGDDAKRQDCRTVLAMMRDITGEEPTMWGGSIIGFGGYHYKYASGREGDWFVTGFSRELIEKSVAQKQASAATQQ